MDIPAVHYADTGAGKVAYQVWGEGPVDVLFTGSIYGAVDATWDIPALARIRAFFGTIARVAHLDHRGLGASDPLPGPWSIDAWAEDVVAVLDAIGSTSVALMAEHVGGHVALRVALDQPDRVRSLCLMNTAARFVSGDGYDLGLAPEMLAMFEGMVRERWGTGLVYGMLIGDHALDRATLARYERLVGPPSVMTALTEATLRSDVRDLLPDVRCPALVVHTGDTPVPIEQAQDLHERLAGSRLLAAESTSLYWSDVLAESSLLWLLGESAEYGEKDLVTILFTDVVGSTDRARDAGDESWRRDLDALDDFVQREVRRRGGRLVKQTGDGHLVELRGPSDAVRLAMLLVDGARSLGTPIRAGLHTGEVLRRGDDLSGIAVHAGARISAMAAANEILVSRTVHDLAQGSGIGFSSRGSFALKGLDDEWELFAVRR
jgi:class 3 adenylate cyclase